MNPLVRLVKENPAHSNGALAAVASEQLGVEVVAEETKKEKKKRKKAQRKAEKLEHEELRAKMEAAYPRVKATPPTHLDLAKVAEEAPKEKEKDKDKKAVSLADWLRPVARQLDSDRSVTATKSSFLIAINCVMLSLTAHSLYRDAGAGTLWTALIPLALTNVLSLGFAIFSAQVREKPTTLDAMWSMPEAEYEPAIASMLQSKERLYATLTEELHLQGAALASSRKYLRTAYNVLLGGIGLSLVTFVLCLLLGARA